VSPAANEMRWRLEDYLHPKTPQQQQLEPYNRVRLLPDLAQAVAAASLDLTVDNDNISGTYKVFVPKTGPFLPAAQRLAAELGNQSDLITYVLLPRLRIGINGPYFRPPTFIIDPNAPNAVVSGDLQMTYASASGSDQL